MHYTTKTIVNGKSWTAELKKQTIDKKEQNLVAKETKKWQEILTRMFDIIKFLAKQNLAFRGHTEDDTSINRGNFL